MRSVLLVGLGGALGAVCRYLIGRIPVHAPFPILTLLINVTGALLIGAVTGFMLRGNGLSEAAVLFWKTGVCGGFTTFSAVFSRIPGPAGIRQIGMGALYILLSIGLCLGGVTLGRRWSGSS